MTAYDTVTTRLAERTGGTGRNGDWPCPAHDDNTPSLSVSPGNEGVVLHCHAGCDTADVVAALGLIMADLFDASRSNGEGRSEVVARYPYVDEQGTLLFTVERFEPGFDGARKSFAQRPANGKRGRGAMTGVRRVVFQLPQVLEAVSKGEMVFVVEGEKDVLAMERHGATATTNPGGAGKWRTEYNASFQGADVTVITDLDDAGRKHAHEVATQLATVAKTVRLAMPYEGNDPADHFRLGHSLDQFLDIDHDDKQAGVVPVDLTDCIATFQRWLHLPDSSIVTATLGAAAANLIPGDPLWLLIVGPPSSAKTECLSALIPLPYVHPAAKVTEAALLSGTPTKERDKAAKGGLLRHIGDFGIMLIKDFTSVLAQNRDARNEAVAALREVFDGRWDRPIGGSGGLTLTWVGKCGLVGGCTPTIDRHHAVMGTLGERFLFFRVTVDGPDDQATRRLTSRRHETDMRSELVAAAGGVLAGVDRDADFPLDPDEDRWLVSLAVWTARARTPVERDGYDREVVVMPESEGPARIVTQLGAMRDGLIAIKAPLHERWIILHKLAWDAMPTMRREVLEALHSVALAAAMAAFLAAVPTDDWVKRADLMNATDIPRTPLERELEDLVLIGLAEQRKDGTADNSPWKYRLSPEARTLWPKAAPKRTGPPSDGAPGPSSKEMSTGSSTYRGSTNAEAQPARDLLEEAFGSDIVDEDPDDYGRRMNPGELGPLDPETMF